MANDIQEIGFIMPSGAVHYVPSAHSAAFVMCGTPSCGAVHVFLMHQAGIPFAETTVSRTMCQRMIDLINEEEEGKLHHG